jgi:DNA polymerase III delta prime subunit
LLQTYFHLPMLEIVRKYKGISGHSLHSVAHRKKQCRNQTKKVSSETDVIVQIAGENSTTDVIAQIAGENSTTDVIAQIPDEIPSEGFDVTVSIGANDNLFRPSSLMKNLNPEQSTLIVKNQSRAKFHPDTLPWVDKYSDKFIGQSKYLSMILEYIARRGRLRHSKPVAVLLRGPLGSGKTTLVSQAASESKSAIRVFGVGDLDTKADFEQDFVAAVKCVGFKKSIVVVDGVEDIDNFEHLLSLLSTLHGVETRTKCKYPQAGNALILIGSNSYSKRFDRLKKYCACINIPAPTNKILRQILSRISKDESCHELDGNMDTLITASHGNASLMINQAEFYKRNQATSGDHNAEFGNILQLIERLRWPSNSLMESPEYFEEALKSQKSLLYFLSVNLADSRTSIEDCSLFHDTLSDTDGMPREYIAGLIHGTLSSMPQGNKPRIKYPSFPRSPNMDVLLAGAYANHTTVAGLLDRMTYIQNRLSESRFDFQVFDGQYQDDHDLSIKELMILNSKVQSFIYRKRGR